MIAKVDVHMVKEGMLEQAKAQVVSNTEVAKSTGAVIARQMLVSQNDPLKLITITVWKNKEVIEEYIKEVIAKVRASGEPSPWASIEGDEYDVTTLV